MIDLFDKIYAENYKYINAVDALYFLVSEENYPLSKIAKFLLSCDYHKSVKTYKKNHLDKIEMVDFYQEDDNHWYITRDILNKALNNFIYDGDVQAQPYKESDYEDYFWLKDDLYNFEGFKKLGVKVDNDEYEKYLTYKQIDSPEKSSQKDSPIIKAFKDMEENLNSYWNLRVLPKIFERMDDNITLFDILRIAIRNYTVSYQFLGTFFHKFIYCPDDNLLDATQNDILLSLIENELNPSDDRLYKPISRFDFLESSFPYSLVSWNIDEIGDFFIKQDNKIFEYENTLPRFHRGDNNSNICLNENERLRTKLAQAQERIKQLEAEKQENTISNELTGIEKLNQSAKDRQGMARVIAMKLWKDDQSILIGAMADKVYREMINYCVDELPDNADTLKNWIRPIATSQAQRRGRPPKKSTT